MTQKGVLAGAVLAVTAAAAIVLPLRGAVAGDIDVMTQNQYLGADLGTIVTAAATGNPSAINDAVVAALRQVASSKPAERMAAQAAVISKRRPALVALQESEQLSCSDPNETGACSDPSIGGAFTDFLASTLGALDGAYKAEAVVANFGETIPFDLYGTGQLAYLTILDRDAIISRKDIEASPVNFDCTNPSLDGCNYEAALGAGTITVERGYVGVDTSLDGTDYRVVTTHLEVKAAPIPAVFQQAQAQELITTLNATTPAGRTLIVLGDFNSSPDESLPAPYAQFETFGYTDAWLLRPGDVEGFTCCQAADLSNRHSSLDERIDLVFSKEAPVKVQRARVLGDEVSAKTPPPGHGLWPSDHGAVASNLAYP